jgi:DNA-binding GntR family transcriptional regulator
VNSGLSRSTVREALRLLTSQHLITTTRGVTGGSFVSHPSTAELADTHLFEVRELIELPAAALAARRAGPEDVRALRAAQLDPAVDDVSAMLATQRAFHHALVAASGNPVLEVIARPLYAVESKHPIGRHTPPDFWTRVDVEHRAITDAIAAGDPAAARRAAADHLHHIRQAHTRAAAAEGPTDAEGPNAS